MKRRTVLLVCFVGLMGVWGATAASASARVPASVSVRWCNLPDLLCWKVTATQPKALDSGRFVYLSVPPAELLPTHGTQSPPGGCPIPAPYYPFTCSWTQLTDDLLCTMPDGNDCAGGRPTVVVSLQDGIPSKIKIEAGQGLWETETQYLTWDANGNPDYSGPGLSFQAGTYSNNFELVRETQQWRREVTLTY